MITRKHIARVAYEGCFIVLYCFRMWSWWGDYFNGMSECHVSWYL